ncbi:MAG: hypothetical protein ACLS29_04600 [Prevotellamassilia sp.]
MDFLGLKTLSIIKGPSRTSAFHWALPSTSTTSSRTRRLTSSTATGAIGTFQFESTGMQKYLRELQPSTFGDLIAQMPSTVGPVQYIPSFIA